MNWYNTAKKQGKKEKMVSPFARSMSYTSHIGWYKVSKEVSNEYSWVYINLPSQVVKTMIEFGKKIDPDDLYVKEAEDGLELDPHVTVKYALLTNETKDIRDLLKDEKCGKFYLGESSIFEQDKYDVVKIDVESDDLKRLHERLNNLPHEDKYPDYHAHATIAYVKSGTGKKYIGKFKINKSFKFDDVFFGDQDKKDHKIKLAFNLLQYRYAQIWNVDISNEGIEDKISALYELEYKYSMVRDRFQGHPVRKTNILDNLKSSLSEVLTEVKNIFIYVFRDWLEKHALLSSDTWARGRTSELDSDDLGVEDHYIGMVNEYMRYAIYGGRGFRPTDTSSYNRYFEKMLSDVEKDLSNFPIFSKVLELSLRDYKDMLRNELLNIGFKKFGENYNKRFRNEDQAEKFIEELTVKNVDPDTLFYSEGISGFAQAVDNMGYATEVLEEFYKNFVFPYWVEYWKGMGIEETRENVEKMYKKLDQISPNNIRESLAIISLAIQTSHQSGDMIEYISEYAGGEISAREMKRFLDEMSSGSKTAEWNEELRDIGVEI